MSDKKLTDREKEVLQFIHARLLNHYQENPNVDYMATLKKIIAPAPSNKIKIYYGEGAGEIVHKLGVAAADLGISIKIIPGIHDGFEEIEISKICDV